MTTRRTLRARLAVATVLALAVVGCGDDGGDDEQTAASTEDTVDGTTASTTEAPDDTTEPSGTTAGEAPDICEALPADTVAGAAGAEVVDTRPTTGTGSLDGIDYATAGCTYDLADDGSVDVRVLTDPSGALLTSDGFAELQATSAGRRGSDDFPHEDVSDLGTGAFFLAGLLSNQLFVDTGSLVLELDGDAADEPLPRDTLRAIAVEAVTAVG